MGLCAVGVLKMLHIFYCIAPIFCLILIGYIARLRFLTLRDFWKGSERITYYLLFPALLINALVSVNLDKDIHTVIISLLLSTVLLGFGLILLQKMYPINKSSFTSYFQGVIRYNSYVFIGVAAAIYGAKSLSIVAIIIVYMIVVTNVFSVIILSIYASESKPKFADIIKSIFKNPLVVACIIGIFLNKTHFLYPDMIKTLFEFLGGAALPISLMCVGAGLRFSHVAEHIKPIALINFSKLILFPLVSFLFLNLFHVPEGMIKNIALLYSAAPCAGNAYILALQMKGDAETMAAIISTTTLVSMITIPLVIRFL